MDSLLSSSLPVWLTYCFATFAAFFPIIDPIGIIPLFNALTDKVSLELCKRIAFRSCVLATFLTLFFGFMGDIIFDIFQITLDALKIVGGIIFFFMGYDMLNARISSLKLTDKTDPIQSDTADDIAITPLAIPLLCGPGALTCSIIMMEEADGSFAKKIGFVLGVCIIFFFTFICFLLSKKVGKLLGHNGSKVILRIMGLFLMVLSVNYFFDGLKPIIREMLIPVK